MSGIVWPVILVNVVTILVIAGASLFIEYREFYSRLSFSEVIEYQIFISVLLGVFEVALVLFFLFRYLRHEQRITVDTATLLEQGENKNIEFKSSLRWDYKAEQVNKELEYVIAKTIAAFLNTEGGFLFIGVNDDKHIIGIESDYNTLQKQSADGFLVHLTHIINTYIGREFHRFIDIEINRIEDRDICRIQIAPSKTPVFISHNGHQEFFVRATAATQLLEVRDAHEYIKTHWKRS